MLEDIIKQYDDDGFFCEIHEIPAKPKDQWKNKTVQFGRFQIQVEDDKYGRSHVLMLEILNNKVVPAMIEKDEKRRNAKL